MVTWKVVLTKDTQKDAKKITASSLKPKVEKLLSIVRENPYQPPYEKLGICGVKIEYDQNI